MGDIMLIKGTRESNEKFPDAMTGIKRVQSDYEKALEIILGLHDSDINTSNDNIVATRKTALINEINGEIEESELIRKAKELRNNILGGINANTT